VRSDVIIIPTVLAAAATVTYTTPSGERTLVKYLTIRSGGNGVQCDVEIDPGTGTFVKVITRITSAANQSNELTAFLVLETGHKIRFNNVSGSTVQVSAHGAKLLL
jgi:hypothetical protein